MHGARFALTSTVGGQMVRSTRRSLDAKTSFIHPGTLDSKQDLDFVKAQIQAGNQPWTNVFNARPSKRHFTFAKSRHRAISFRSARVFAPAQRAAAISVIVFAASESPEIEPFAIATSPAAAGAAPFTD